MPSASLKFQPARDLGAKSPEMAKSVSSGFATSPTSTLLGSVEKSRSGIAAGVLNATRQTGSVLGVALFGSLVGRSDAFMSGAHRSLVISAMLLFVAGTVIWRGASASGERPRGVASDRNCDLGTDS